MRSAATSAWVFGFASSLLSAVALLAFFLAPLGHHHLPDHQAKPFVLQHRETYLQPCHQLGTRHRSRQAKTWPCHHRGSQRLPLLHHPWQSCGWSFREVCGHSRIFLPGHWGTLGSHSIVLHHIFASSSPQLLFCHASRWVLCHFWQCTQSLSHLSWTGISSWSSCTCPSCGQHPSRPQRGLSCSWWHRRWGQQENFSCFGFGDRSNPIPSCGRCLSWLNRKDMKSNKEVPKTGYIFIYIYIYIYIYISLMISIFSFWYLFFFYNLYIPLLNPSNISQ